MSNLLRILHSFFTFFTPLGVIFAPLVLLWSQVNNISAAISGLASGIQTATGYLSAGGFSSAFGFANNIIPITECLQMIGILLGLQVTCAGIRILKSWIPTLS